MNSLLYRRLSSALDDSHGWTFNAYLIVCDGISQVLDEAIQSVGTVGVLQELPESVLF